MTGALVKPYQETVIIILGQGEFVQLANDLEWSRDGIDAEEVEVDHQLDIMKQLNQVATGNEENEANDPTEIEVDIEDGNAFLDNNSVTNEEDDLTVDDTEIDEGNDEFVFD